MGKKTNTKQTFLVLGETQTTEDELKRYKKPYWWEIHARAGTFREEHQQLFALDFNTRDNYDSPVPLEKLTQTAQTAVQTPPEDPDADYMTAIRRTRKHSRKTIIAPVKTAYNKHAKSQFPTLNIEGAVENPKYSPPTPHPYPHFPADLDKQANEFYPYIHLTLAKLLYLRNNNQWQFKTLAFRFNSSPQQIENWHTRASLLNILHQRIHAQTF